MARKKAEKVFESFADPIINDPRLTGIMLDVMKREIVENGVKPSAAAYRAGMSRGLFKDLMNNEAFSALVEDLQGEYKARIYSYVNNSLERLAKAKDDVQVMDKGMKLLERIDQEFGTKHSSLSVNKPNAPKINPETDPEIQSMISQAERISNTTLPTSDD